MIIILSGYRNGIWNRKMCYANYEKRKKADGIELLNQERISTFAEKENYFNLGILEMDSIK